MTVSPAFAHYWDDGWDEEWGFWTGDVDWDVE